MIESFNELIHLFTDKTRSWGHKTTIFISIIAVVFMVDYCFNITYNLALNNKISQLETIQKLKIGYANDTLKLKKIEQIENQVINKVHYSDYIKETLFENLNIKSIPKIVTNNPKNQLKKVTVVEPAFSLFWMVVSSNYLFVIVIPFLILTPLFQKTKINSTLLLGQFATLIIISLLICSITWIAYKIPLIGNNPVYNYILNFIIHSSFIGLSVAMNKNKQK